MLVFPSKIEEAFGRVLIESMAAECIPISAKIGGTTDIITNKKNGYFFEPGDTNQLIKILERLELNKINKKTLKNESKKYNGSILAKKLIKIYKNLI